MKPPSIPELERIRDRFDPARIEHGEEPDGPLGPEKQYLVGREWVSARDLVRRLVRRCLELEGFVQGEADPLVWWGGRWMREGKCQEPGDRCLACERLGKHLEPVPVEEPPCAICHKPRSEHLPFPGDREHFYTPPGGAG